VVSGEGFEGVRAQSADGNKPADLWLRRISSPHLPSDQPRGVRSLTTPDPVLANALRQTVKDSRLASERRFT
jgi:hypothetical protein